MKPRVEGVLEPRTVYHEQPPLTDSERRQEVSWWNAWFESRGLSWPSDFEARLNPQAPLQSRISALVQGSDAMSILDVGSGPISRTGRLHPNGRVHLTSVDPLADEYRSLLAAHGCDVSLGPLRGEAENLAQLFGSSTFDLVNMENALGQCRDPIKAITQMLDVVKPGGTVLLLHEENEAAGAAYSGLVRWNVTENAGRFVLWNPETSIDITEVLRGQAKVVTERVEEPDYRRAIVVSIEKAGAAIAPAAVSKRGNLSSLAWTLIRTDFKIRYHGSPGGFVWALLRPLTLFVVLQTVFSLIFTTDPRYRLNLIVGLFLWEFFVESTRSALGSLAAKAHLLTKVRVPAWLLVVCSTANALLMLAIFVTIILGALAFGGTLPPPSRLALFFLYILEFYGITLGFGLAASVLFLKFRDVNQLWDLTTQAGFFAAPIIYPLAILPERFHMVLYAWPPTPVIQFSREVLISGTVPSLRAHLLLAAVSLTALLAGSLIFSRNQRRAVEFL